VGASPGGVASGERRRMVRNVIPDGATATEGPRSGYALLLRGPSGRYRSPRDDTT
jgi:hypothetical protein